MGKADRSTCKIFEMRVGESANQDERPIICGRSSESKMSGTVLVMGGELV